MPERRDARTARRRRAAASDRRALEARSSAAASRRPRAPSARQRPSVMRAVRRAGDRSCPAAACRARRPRASRSRPAGRRDGRSGATSGFQPPETRERDRRRCVSCRSRCRTVTPSTPQRRPPCVATTAPPSMMRAPACAAPSGSPATLGAAVDRRLRPSMPARGEIARRAPAVVVVGEDRDAPPGRDGEAVDVGAHAPTPASRRAGRCRRRRCGRSIAPAASTARLATIRQRRWRG